MKQAVVCACLVYNYRWLRDEPLYREAKQSPKSYYPHDLEARAEDLGIVQGRMLTVYE